MHLVGDSFGCDSDRAAQHPAHATDAHATAPAHMGDSGVAVAGTKGVAAGANRRDRRCTSPPRAGSGREGASRAALRVAWVAASLYYPPNALGVAWDDDGGGVGGAAAA